MNTMLKKLLNVLLVGLMFTGMVTTMRPVDKQLSDAADCGDLAAAKAAITAGADIEAKSYNGCTHLHWAAEKGHADVVLLLLDPRSNSIDLAGADPNARSKNGSTPLHYAARDGHVEVAKLLLDRGVDPNARSKNGDTPLLIAVYNGHVGLVKLLLSKGSDPNARSNDGSTPLRWAALKGDIGVGQIMLSHMRSKLKGFNEVLKFSVAGQLSDGVPVPHLPLMIMQMLGCNPQQQEAFR